MFKILDKNKKGFSLVEVLLSGALFAILAMVLLGGLIYGQEGTLTAGKTTRATLLAEEGLEAVRNIRDNNFTNLIDGTYGLAISGGQWTLSGTSDSVDVFTRNVVISTVDADRKSVVSNVTWQQNAQRSGSISLASRLMYWRKIVATIGNWTNPNTLAGSLDLSGGTTGFEIQVQGSYAYIIRSGANNFSIVNISNPASPTLSATLSLVGTLNNIAVSGNYAYVVGADNNSELQIVNISNPASPSVVGTFNAAGNADALGVEVSGNYAYITRVTSANYEFAVVNVTTPATPSLAGSLDFTSNVNDVAISGNYAYLATADTANELRVINITTPGSPALTGSLNLSGSSAATTIAAFGTTAVIGAGTSLYIANASTPASPTQAGAVGVGATINDISLGNNNTYVFMGTSSTTAELDIYDISNPAAPSSVGSYNAAGAYNGVAYDSASDRLYAATAITTAELNVIAP